MCVCVNDAVDLPPSEKPYMYIPVARDHQAREGLRRPVGPEQVAVQPSGAVRHEEERGWGRWGWSLGMDGAPLARVVGGRDGEPQGDEEAAVDLICFVCVVVCIWDTVSMVVDVADLHEFNPPIPISFYPPHSSSMCSRSPRRRWGRTPRPSAPQQTRLSPPLPFLMVVAGLRARGVRARRCRGGGGGRPAATARCKWCCGR